MPDITAQDLRNIVEEGIAGSIELHRSSRFLNEGQSYDRPTGHPTDEEINDFIGSIPDLDEETREQLLDQGFLGFHAKTARAADEWLRDFRQNVSDWAKNKDWLAADFPWRGMIVARQPSESELWRPGDSAQPGWLATAPAALLLAADLLKSGRLLSDMPWRQFEEMIGALLEAEGWRVTVTQPSKDGGIDVVALREDSVLGHIRSVWQAKRYSSSRKVRLSEVRELSGVVEVERATKGVIVTTSRLTNAAIDWIRRDKFRLDYKDSQKVESWVRTIVLGCNEGMRNDPEQE